MSSARSVLAIRFNETKIVGNIDRQEVVNLSPDHGHAVSVLVVPVGGWCSEFASAFVNLRAGLLTCWMMLT